MKSVRHLAKKSNSYDLLRLFFSLFFVGFVLGLVLFFSDFSFLKANMVTTTMPADPYEVLQTIKKGSRDQLLVDIRSRDDFNKAHIKTAESFPLYTNTEIPLTIDNSRVQDFEKEFSKRDKKEIIIYGHFIGSLQTQIFVKTLQEKGMPVRALGVGWNEWKHFRNLWVPESQWNTLHTEEFIEYSSDKK